MNLKERVKALPVSSKRLLGIGIVMALVVALPLFIWGIVTQRFLISQKAQVERVTIPVDGEPFLGPIDAPVTIIEYGDLQCPFCKDFTENTLPQIRATYPTQVKFVFKDFPLTDVHPLAQHAAIAGQCAFAQNKFWEMHDLIYLNQDTLSEQSFATFSAQLSLDQTQFDTCYTNQTPLPEINQDLAEGQGFGVVGTPTFFINGIKLEGAQPFSAFQTLIDSELNPSPSPTVSPTPTPTACASVPMTLTITPNEQSGGIGTTKRYQISVTNNDSAGCGTHTVYLTPSVPQFEGSDQTGWIINISDQSFVIGPLGTFNTFVDVKSPTSNYSLGVYNLAVNLMSVNIPQNATSSAFYFNLTGGSPSPTPTATPIETPSPSPTPQPTYVPGEPNSCNGTCGSHENCQANYFCYQSYCRNPLCPNDSACGCASPTPTGKPKLIAKASPTMQVINLAAPFATIKPKVTPYVLPTVAPMTIENPGKFNFLLYIAGGSFLLALLLLGISKIKPPTSNF